MILHLFRRTPPSSNIASLYGTIVAQARTPIFFQDYGVPDTVNGRFEMIALHAVLFLGRLEGEAADLRRLGQAVFDLFCRDMDASMREMGVGDLTVPKKMRRIGFAFYDRQAEYLKALAVPDDGPLAAALARIVLDGPPQSSQAESLARYVRAAARALADQEGAAFARSELHFADPERVASVAGQGARAHL
jgi:cytochrome b pre-mRNA-processing protein 3